MNRDRLCGFSRSARMGWMVVLLSGGCGITDSTTKRGGPQPSRDYLVELDWVSEPTEIGSNGQRYLVMSSDTLDSEVEGGGVRSPHSVDVTPTTLPSLVETIADPEDIPSVDATEESTLILGFPVSQLQKPHQFGTTITKVSDPTSETLGMLKLANFLPPFSVTPIVATAGDDSYWFSLIPCTGECDLANEEPMVTIPIVGMDETESFLLLDIAAIGRELNIMGILDRQGNMFGFVEDHSQATLVDFGDGTLVFDVDSRMLPSEGGAAARDGAQENPTITARWFIRPDSSFAESQFVSRPATDGVGFFMTQLGSEERISRFAISEDGRTDSIHYYIKAVPDQYKSAFAAAFENWNGLFESLGAQPPFTWSFVDPSDANYNLLVAGDPRWNVVEWDLNNLAPYGGLGPSHAHQETGQIFNANVLVQGPTIEWMYRLWFQSHSDYLASVEADDPGTEPSSSRESARSAQNQSTPASPPQISLTLGKSKFRVPAQMPEYQDQLARDLTFYNPPADETFDSYMDKYFTELLSHELGHNLGLRHNFRGNLGSNDQASSRSVMEYLNRAYRHKSSIGPYDAMAIAYGYFGHQPDHLDWFCTDEDVVSSAHPTNSAECSKNDATKDSFGFFTSTLQRAVDLLVGRGSTEAPEWTYEELKSELKTSLNGLSGYASSASSTFSSWTNWQQPNENRPSTADNVSDYVLEKIANIVCNPSLLEEASQKESELAQAATTQNITLLQEATAEVISSYHLQTDDPGCT